MKKITGFTLIELLVVISIIGVLIALSLVSLGESRESARDTKRKADLQTIASAIELYKADCAYYPYINPYTSGTSITGSNCYTGSNSNVYLELTPDDPIATRNYSYSLLSCTGSSPNFLCPRYQLYAALENPSTGDLLPACSTSVSCGDKTCNYCITSP